MNPPHIIKIFLGATLASCKLRVVDCHVEILESNFFRETDSVKQKEKQDLLEWAVVIVNNNDIIHGKLFYARLYSQCQNTIFVVWDFDNHHWLEMSTFLAVHSDVYAPGNHENLYILSRFNFLTVGPVHCSTIQWSRGFLANRLSDMLTVPRLDEPLGKHIYYSCCSYRNRVITTLNQFYPSIGLTDTHFHSHSPEDRLKEWYSHKVHWIAPLLNDVPNRLFDAIVTGGIPIVPESLRFLPLVRDINRDYIQFYSPLDVINPNRIHEKAIEMFNHGGTDKIAERHRYALEHHHVDSRIDQLLNYVTDIFEIHLLKRK